LYLKKVDPEIRNNLMAEKLRNAYDTFLESTLQQLNVIARHNALFVKYQPVPGNAEDPETGTAENHGTEQPEQQQNEQEPN
jgi:hypothetical protein